LVSRSDSEHGQIGRAFILSAQENDKENNMTTRIDSIFEGGSRTRWQKLTATFTAFGEAISYDSEEHREAIIKNLWGKVSQLETRVSELETREKRVA
jgi:hypothetical protein